MTHQTHKSHQFRQSRRLALMLGAASAVTLVAACGAPGSGSSSAPPTKAPSAVSTDPASAGKTTLTVWDQEVRGGQNAQITKLNKEFEAKYPNVTIKRTAKSFTDLKTTLKLALSGNNPPDVVQANQGYPDMVSFVKAGMLTPLDSYAKVYGWDQRYPASLLDLNRVSDDASHFGEGKLYGLSQMGEYVGVYYNKDNLKKLGLQPPKTWQDFEADLPKIKAKGQTPIMFGNLDKWPAIHTFGVIQAQLAGADAVRNLVFGTGGSWTDKPTVQAATTLQDWVKKGYFSSGVNGLKYDDAAKQFGNGQGVFLITGTWEAAVLKPTMGSSLGLMVTPAPSGQQPTTTGGESLAFGITSKAADPDVAAAYINFITDANAGNVMTETGNLPAVPSEKGKALSTSNVDGELVQGWDQLSQANGLVPYLDYSTPTFYDTITASLQSLIGGQMSPDDFAKSLEDDYSKFHQG